MSRSSPALARPVVFGATMGFLHPGDADLGVLMVGAVGYEELCLRTTWRALGEAISAKGPPCLRFDLPGVGDALEPDAPIGIEDWRLAVLDAARFLKAETGCARVALVGQGMGAALAALAAPEIEGLEAAVFMAPVTSGRLYLRELSLWGAMLVDRIGVGPDPDHASGVAVGGIAIEPGRLATIKALDMTALEVPPAPRALVVRRDNHGGDERFASRLAALGVAVATEPYDGYEIVASDPTQARPPEATIARIAGWIAEVAGDAKRPSSTPAISSAPELVGNGFRERPVLFGPDGRLFGVVCEPETPRDGPAIVFVNAGRDYHIGWARTTIEQARGFARLGLASLRFDCSGVGDSPAPPGTSGETLYSDAQVADVLAAIEELARHGHARIGVMGRCSGSYAAFHAAVADARVSHLAMINTERFVWDPREDVTEALEFAQRPIGDFGATFIRRNGFRRLLKGELRVAPAAKYVSRRIIRAAGRRLAPHLGRLTPEARLFQDVHHRFRALAERGTKVAVVYAVDDHGLIELDAYFGPGGQRLSAYPNARLDMVADADHNFTHRGARARLFETLRRVFAG